MGEHSGIEASAEGGAWSQHDATLWGALQVSSPPPTLVLACVAQTSAPVVRQWPQTLGDSLLLGYVVEGTGVGATDGEGGGPANSGAGSLGG